MKVKQISTEHKMKPIELHLTIETREEAQALYAIFNYVPNGDLLGDKASDEIKDLIGGKYEVLSNDVIANGITYNEFYNRKE